MLCHGVGTRWEAVGTSLTATGRGGKTERQREREGRIE